MPNKSKSILDKSSHNNNGHCNLQEQHSAYLATKGIIRKRKHHVAIG